MLAIISNLPFAMKKYFPIRFTIVLVLVFFISVLRSQAQKEGNTWYFGSYAGLSFASGAPVAITNSALFTYDNSSTVSDSAGNLLFYSNGETVWNKNHQVMQNGAGISGSNTGGQSALIIKQPSSSTIYYLFTSDAFGASGGLHYTIVDLSLNNGIGGVTQKNILLHNPSTEKLAGFFSCATNTAWLISHKANSNEFYC